MNAWLQQKTLRNKNLAPQLRWTDKSVTSGLIDNVQGIDLLLLISINMTGVGFSIHSWEPNKS